MSNFRKIFSTGAIVLALCSVSAYAQQPQPTPRFAFLTKEKITLSPGGKSASVLVQNNTAESLAIDLRVIDIEPKAQNLISPVIRVDPTTIKLEPMGSWTITVSIPTASPAPASTSAGKGYLVAIERAKQDFDRREIEIVAPKPSDIASNAPSPVPADTLDIIGLQGTNFLPSLISLGWSAIALSLIAVVLTFAFWRRYLKMKAAHIVGAIVLTAMALILGAIADHAFPLNWSLIKIKSIPLTIGKGINAGVISAEGLVGQIEANGNQLSVVGLSRAGTYDGQLKLGPEKEARTIKVSAKISDWWPYALLTIIAGVVLGYRVTKYFNERRSEDALRLRSAQLQEKIADDEVRFQSENRGLPFAHYNILDLASEWLQRVEDNITQHDVTGGGARLDRLTAYVDLFARFREQLKGLYKLQSATWDQIKPSISLDRSRVKVLVNVDELFTQPPLRFPTEDEQGTQLKRYQLLTEALIDWVMTMHSQFKSILGFLEDAEGIDKSELEVEKRKELEKQLAVLRTAVLDVLLADSKNDLSTYYDNAQKAMTTIRGLVDETTVPSAAAEMHFLRNATVISGSVLERVSEKLQLEHLLSSIRYRELQMTIIAGLLTAGLGLYTLYLNKPVWGTTADYLYAVLWGSVLSEGLKYGANIVGRIWKP